MPRRSRDLGLMLPSLLGRLSVGEMAALLAPMAVSHIQRERSVIDLRRCGLCAEYAPSGSLSVGRSLCCYAALHPAVR
jgi:hypothetical protein